MSHTLGLRERFTEHTSKTTSTQTPDASHVAQPDGVGAHLKRARDKTRQDKEEVQDGCEEQDCSCLFLICTKKGADKVSW